MGLKRVLRLPTVVSTSAGLTLATACFVAAVQVATFVAGDSAWLAILTAGALCLLAGLCFSELNGMLPSAAGLRLYFSRAFSDRFSLVVSILYMAIITTVVGAESFILSQVLTQVIPAVPSWAWIAAIYALVTVTNLRGVKIAGRFQDVITFGLIGALVVLGVLALAKNGLALTNPWHIDGAGGFVNAVAVGVFLFIGFEWVTPLAEEVTDVKLISKGLLLAVGILAVVYALFTVAMTSTVGVAALKDTPVPHLIFGQALLGRAGLIIMTVLSVMASATTFNAGVISISRFMYASARENVLPKSFAQLNRYFTPQISILVLVAFVTLVTGVVFVSDSYLTLVNLGAAMEAVIYTLAALAVLALRRREPERERPFKVAGGAVIPIVTAAIFALLALAVLSTDLTAAAVLGMGLVGCLAYVTWVVPYLRRKAAAQRAAAPRRRPRPVNEEAPPGSS